MDWQTGYRFRNESCLPFKIFFVIFSIPVHFLKGNHMTFKKTKKQKRTGAKVKKKKQESNSKCPRDRKGNSLPNNDFALVFLKIPHAKEHLSLDEECFAFFQ